MRKIIESGSGAIYEGTNILVADIKQALAGGRPQYKILQTYPALDVADLKAALAWSKPEAEESTSEELDEPETQGEPAPAASAEKPAPGPTLLEFVKAGYSPANYPPHDFAPKPYTDTEKAEADALHAKREADRAAEKAEADAKPAEPPAADPLKEEPPT